MPAGDIALGLSVNQSDYCAFFLISPKHLKNVKTIEFGRVRPSVCPPGTCPVCFSVPPKISAK